MPSQRFPEVCQSAIAAAAIVLFPALAHPSPLTAQTAIEQAVANLEWRELGPAIVGGRIADIAAVESETRIFYVATACSVESVAIPGAACAAMASNFRDGGAFFLTGNLLPRKCRMKQRLRGPGRARSPLHPPPIPARSRR